jgi:hypothetical protein
MKADILLDEVASYPDRGVGLPPDLRSPISDLAPALHAPTRHRLAKATDKERDRANLKDVIFRDIHRQVVATGKKNIVMDLCTKHAADLQRRGFSSSRLYNDYYKWLRGGKTITALLPANTATRSMPLAAVQFIHGWMQRNKRSSKQGWADFIEKHWSAGEPVPGYGTWRDWFLTRWPDRALPRLCPPDLPTGWSYENLIDKLDPVETAAARRGIAAALSLLPSIPGTRAGMRPLEWITFDDVKLDFRVHVESVGRPVDVVALVAFDIATATVLGFGIRPVLLREDGTGEKLKARDTKALLVSLWQSWGWPGYGQHVIQENGTAYAPPAFQAAASEATGGLVRFHDASMISGTAWAGGFADRAVGNSRAKSWLESTFNPFHNRLAHIEGQTGRRYDVAPQDDHGRRQELKAMVKAGEALSPDLRAQLRLSYRHLAEVRPLVAEAIRGLNHRHDHALKDFEDVLVWRFREGDAWMEEAEQLDFRPEQLEHILTDLVPETPAQRFDRLMGIERCADAQFFRLHPDSVPRLLDDQKWIKKEGREVTFDIQKKTCLYSIYTESNVETLEAMEDGREYLAYFDLSSGQVPPTRLYVTSGDGRWIGTLDLTTGLRRSSNPVDKEAASKAIAKKKSLLNQVLQNLDRNSPQVAEENEERIEHNLEIVRRGQAVTMDVGGTDDGGNIQHPTSNTQHPIDGHTTATATVNEDQRVKKKARALDPGAIARAETARRRQRLSAEKPAAAENGDWL